MSMNKTSGFTHGVSNNAIGFTHGFSKIHMVSLMSPINGDYREIR
jgi:hypothetical protein